MSNSLINSKWWRAITSNKLLRELILWTFLPCIWFIIKYVVAWVFFCSQLWKLKLLWLNCSLFFIFTYRIRSQHFSSPLLLWILRIWSHIINRWNICREMPKLILSIPNLLVVWRVQLTRNSRRWLLLLSRLIHINCHWMLDWISCNVVLSGYRIRMGLLRTSSGWILVIRNCTLCGLFRSSILRCILSRYWWWFLHVLLFLFFSQSTERILILFVSLYSLAFDLRYIWKDFAFLCSTDILIWVMMVLDYFDIW